MKSLTMIVGRLFPVWVDGVYIPDLRILDEESGWKFSNGGDLTYIGFKFTALEFLEGKDPDELVVQYGGQTYTMRVEVVFSPSDTQEITVCGIKREIDETQTLVQATVK